MDKFYLLVAGTRTFKDYKLLSNKIKQLTIRYGNNICIVSGEAKGADTLNEDFIMILKDIANLQNGYKEMIEENSFTKKRLCELCVPFRDKYHLTDSQTIAIAREEMPISDIYKLVGDNECI